MEVTHRPFIIFTGRYQDCYDFYFLLDSVITSVRQFHFNTSHFFLDDKLLKIEKIEKVKILHWYINRVHLWHPSTQIPLVHDHMIFQM